EKDIYDIIGFSKSFRIKNLSVYPIKLAYKDKDIIFICINTSETIDGYYKSLMGIFVADIASAIDRARYIEELVRFQDIIDSAFDVIVITDEKAVILYANRSFETVTGYSIEEVIGKKTSILKSGCHNQEFYKRLWATLKDKKVWKGEFINKKKNGEIFYDSSVIYPIYFSNKLNYVCIKRDITEEKRLYQHLIRSQKMEAMGSLAAGLAHDFNNVLTSILGYSEIILNSMTETDRFYKYIKTINKSAQKAGELTRNILSVTRKEKMETKPVDINKIIREVVDLISHSLAKQIELVTNLSDDIPITAADPSQIHQVILNLTVNARDAMPNGGILTISTSLSKKPDTEVNQLTDTDTQFIKISISDTGIGIDEKAQDKIFDPFFTTKPKGKGTGLGLYIVHTIVTNHNGYINFSSKPNEGTTFNIYLPVKEPPKTVEEKPLENHKGSLTILVIDDEEAIRSLCKDMLESVGYQVITANDGVDGIDKYIRHKDRIDAVILDMIMPKKRGDEVFLELKKINPDVKVIICSGFVHEDSIGIDTLLKSGAVGFIQKPFTINTLLLHLKKATGNGS
ncbi:MAG: ATP-binding protein, partial [Thermodesulfovibrionales bacterium]